MLNIAFLILIRILIKTNKLYIIILGCLKKEEVLNQKVLKITILVISGIIHRCMIS